MAINIPLVTNTIGLPIYRTLKGHTKLSGAAADCGQLRSSLSVLSQSLVHCQSVSKRDVWRSCWDVRECVCVCIYASLCVCVYVRSAAYKCVCV